MLPRITHSRTRLRSQLNEYNDALSLFVSADTYPEIFDLRFPEIVKKSQNGWQQKKTMAYLRFPASALDEQELDAINDWCEKFKQYVLIGCNPNITGFFATELDFCMALDFHYDPATERRTIYGEAEYLLKYQSSQQHAKVLGYALNDAISDLPIPAELQSDWCITCIPAPPETRTIPRRLASGIAKLRPIEFVDATLHCSKAPLKNVAVAQKIPLWQDLYRRKCVKLNGDVAGRLVLIVDDLYQSGATMWTFAQHLKNLGAAHVIGLPCVKSLRDSDNS